MGIAQAGALHLSCSLGRQRLTWRLLRLESWMRVPSLAESPCRAPPEARREDREDETSRDKLAFQCLPGFFTLWRIISSRDASISESGREEASRSCKLLISVAMEAPIA